MLVAVPRTDSPILITHVTVIDVTNGSEHADRTVVVTGNRIAAVTAADSAGVPPDARVVDGTGKFVIPGLWDMHVHAAWEGMDQPLGELFVANGVTGVREMWGDPGVIARWQSRVAARDPKTPRIYAAGNLVDGPEPVWPNSIRVHGAEDAKQAIDRLQQHGAGFIKVYSHLPREAYFAIADESKRLGIAFAGHVPIDVTAAEASDSGQRSIEHLTGVAIGCSSAERRLMDIATSAIASRGWAYASAVLRANGARIAAAWDEPTCRALAEKFVHNQTWQTPTITVRHNLAWLGDRAMESDPRLRYMPEFLLRRWENRAASPNFDSETAVGQRAMVEREAQIVGLFWRAGVPILAGTDALNPYCMPGFSLHDELARLVDAGLTPLGALQAATLNPARFLGLTDSLGTIEAGKVADLVVLDADPLADIHNTTRIADVVVNGRLLDEEARRRMMNDASRATGPSAPFRR